VSIEISEIIRTKRKTIALVVTTDAKLIVRAPLSTPKKYIDSLVEKKSGWIIRKQQEIARRNEAYAHKPYVNGKDFMFLGSSCRLEYSSQVSSVVLECSKIILPIDQKSETAKLIREYYLEAGRRIFRERTEYYACLTGIKYKSVRVSAATRRWGSCGVNGTLNFTWRLVMTPLRVIDSVVVHELAHIEFRNHSKDFWARVRMIMPDYDQQRKWLEEHKRLLEVMSAAL
jgi:predicted metal-dependent hydrolase